MVPIYLCLEVKLIEKSNHHVLIVPGITRRPFDFLLKADPTNSTLLHNLLLIVSHRCQAKETGCLEVPLSIQQTQERMRLSRRGRGRRFTQGGQGNEVRQGQAGHFSSQRSWFLRRGEAAERLCFSSLDSWSPGRVRNRVPVNQKECCWQETLRPAQEGFKWKY